MTTPYESTGRREQKSRTREALVAATRALLAEGVTPQVEDAAARAGISRTTAYRYFPKQRALLVAAHPQIQVETLLPEDSSTDVPARLAAAMRAFTAITVDWEPQLRTSLRLSLEVPDDQPVLRQGRAIGWIADALAPLRETHPEIDIEWLAVAIRSATGIESLVWLTDIAGLSRDEAVTLLHWSAQAMLQAALAGPLPARKPARRRPRRSARE
jgi:AcrR family transcriptional regulator